jgi:hypothetical protein
MAQVMAGPARVGGWNHIASWLADSFSDSFTNHFMNHFILSRFGHANHMKIGNKAEVLGSV